MFKIEITRTIGWGGRIDPPAVYTYSESFKDREHAESFAAMMTRNDRFGGIACRVFEDKNHEDSR